MKRLTLLLMILFGAASGLSQDNSQPNDPLTVDEGRQILGQLLELGSCREENTAYRDYIEKDKEQDARERDLSAKELEVEKKNTEIKQKELDLTQEKLEFYQDMYHELTRTRGIKCFLKKLFTAWHSKC